MASYRILKMKSSNLTKENLERSETFQRIHGILKQNKWYKPMLDYLEDATNLNRVYIVTGSSFLLMSLLLYNFGILLICGAVGFLYPGYKTIECLEEFDVQLGRRWLTYWLVFSAYNFGEIFCFFLNWLPGYWVVKCVFLIWCYLPIPTNGSDVVYNFLIQPAFQKNQVVIGDAINQIVKTAQTFHQNARSELDGVVEAESPHLD